MENDSVLKFWAFTCLMWLIHSDLGNNFLTLETMIKRQTIDFLKNLLRNVLNYKFKQRKYPSLTPFQDPVFTASVYTEHVNIIFFAEIVFMWDLCYINKIKAMS